MIVPMKKVSVIMQEKDTVSALGILRSLGALHIRHLQPPRGKNIVSLSEDIATISEAIEVLFKHEPKDLPCMALAKEPLDWRYTAKHIIDLHKRADQLQEYLKTMLLTIREWEPWGDFDPERIKALAEKNIFLRLCKIPASGLEKIPEGIIIEKISSEKGVWNCLLISAGKKDIPFKEIEPPKMSLRRLKERVAYDTKATEVIEKDLHAFVCVRGKLEYIRKELEKEMEFQEALHGTGKEGAIAYVQGFVPSEGATEILEIAKREKWGIVIEEPADDEEVPTLIRNPRWVSLINPVFRLLEIVPGYRELDISLAFFIFFGIFFGILIGDAGYGLAYLSLTALIHRKSQNKIKDKAPFYLFYILSSCAILWGLLTGAFFGQEWCAKLGFKALVPALNDRKFMQSFCFFLGALHLSLAHLWRALLKWPSLAALGDIGWICVLWSAYLFAKMLILADTLPAVTTAVLFTGMALVVLFTNPKKNMLKSIGEGLGTLALSLMNNFTDVVSYVRLFAVGMAGMAIAETCNSMAAGLGKGNPLVIAAGVAILVIGHGLNIILGPMSVLVHGVRLNVLEFSGHAGITWSGFRYKPLKQ